DKIIRACVIGQSERTVGGLETRSIRYRVSGLDHPNLAKMTRITVTRDRYASQPFHRNSHLVEVVCFGRLRHRPCGLARRKQYQSAGRQSRQERRKTCCRMRRRYRGAKQPCEKRAQVIVRTSHLCPLPKKPAYI